MMATVPHVTSGSGLRKFQADGFLFDRSVQEFTWFVFPNLFTSTRFYRHVFFNRTSWFD